MVTHLECQCENPFHTIRLESDKEWNEKTITFFVYKYQPFWGRLKACYYYLFKSGEIDYDSYLMKEGDREKFLEWLE